MYLDFDDHRPETPSVPPVISRREGVLLSLVLHLSMTIAYLLTPQGFFERALVPVAPPAAPQDNVRFVMMEPLAERTVPPPPQAEASDLDRRAATIERPPEAENPAPFSRGNTPDKVVGAPPVEPAGGDRGTGPPAPEEPPTPTNAPTILPTETATAKAAGEGLARSLQNLQQYLQQDNYANERGGQAEQDAQISFDAKGVDFGWWLRRFVAQVKSNWFIPQVAMIMQGRVVITFNVHRNGFISDITLLKTSGNRALDLAAMNALRTSSPTVPLPPEYPDDKAFFTVTFLYNVR
jgi:protein TonB